MKHFLIQKHLSDDEKFEELIKFIDNTDGTIRLIIDSGGGAMHYAGIIVNIINENPEKFELYGCYLYSAAFYIFYLAKCKKKLYHSALGMFHLPYQKFETTSNGKQYYEQDQAHTKNNVEFCNEFNIEFCKKFMTEEELVRLQEPNDVFFTFLRLNQMFPGIEYF